MKNLSIFIFIFLFSLFCGIVSVLTNSDIGIYGMLVSILTAVLFSQKRDL